jgi:hypothetical protein
MATHCKPNIEIWGFLLFSLPNFFGNGNYLKITSFLGEISLVKKKGWFVKAFRDFFNIKGDHGKTS